MGSIKVNKRKGKFFTVLNTRDGWKYVAPFGHDTRDAAKFEAKKYRDRELSTAVIFQYWDKERQYFG